MCDDDIHIGQMSDPTVSRRAFGLLAAAAAAGGATGAHAAEVVVKDIAVKTPDGEADAILAHPAGQGPWPAVLVWTDVGSLRPAFREMAGRLAAEGFVVLTPNPYYRIRKAPVIDATFSFANPVDREKVMVLRATLTPEVTRRDSHAFVAYLDSLAQVDKRKKVGVHGYCLGGGLSMITAATVPDRIGAAASFHGASLATDAADSPHLLIPRMKAEFLVAVARNDDQKYPNEKVRLKEAFDAAKLPAKIEVYPADHGWAVAGAQVYDEAQAERAWSELVALYKRVLA